MLRNSEICSILNEGMFNCSVYKADREGNRLKSERAYTLKFNGIILLDTYCNLSTLSNSPQINFAFLRNTNEDF